MVVGEWNEHVHVAQVVLMVQAMVLFNEAEPLKALDIMALRYVHQVMRVLVTGKIGDAGC